MYSHTTETDSRKSVKRLVTCPTHLDLLVRGQRLSVVFLRKLCFYFRKSAAMSSAVTDFNLACVFSLFSLGQFTLRLVSLASLFKEQLLVL